MNGTFYENPTFPIIKNNDNQTNDEKYYIKTNNTNNILYNNLKKKVNVYTNYQDNNPHRGIIEYYDNDILILSNPETGNWYYLFTKYINYIEFEERVDL